MKNDKKPLPLNSGVSRTHGPAIRTTCFARLLPLLVLLTLPATVQAQFTFTTNNGALTVTGYTGTNAEMVIPETTNGLPVTNIEASAFRSKTNIARVMIPNSVSNIGWGAFYNCTSLTSITIPNSVITIGDAAFYRCTSLTNAEVGNSVTNIGSNAFQYCSSLSNLVIGNSVTSIGDSAFGSCSGLTGVTIPDNVTNIGKFAFYDCLNMTNFTIGNNVSSIGSAGLEYCSSLTTLTIPASVTSIGVRAVFGCTSLSGITVDALNPFYKSVDGVLFNKNQTTLIQFPARKAGNYAITNSVTSISEGAFYNCFGLTTMTIPNSVTSLGASAFAHCWNLQNLTLPTNLARIPQEAFFDCASLTSITIPDSVTDIGSRAFSDCRNLTSLAIGDSVSDIASYAFQYCTSLASVTIPASLTGYGDYRYGDYRYDGPFSVLYDRGIWNDAFYYCPNLTSFYFKGNAPGWSASQSVLSSAIGAVVYYLPGTTGWGPTFRHLPTVLWNPHVQTSDANFGVRANRFGFNITGTANIPLVVEASTNSANPVWVPLQTCALTNGSIYFSDPAWTNYPARFYRLRSP